MKIDKLLIDDPFSIITEEDEMLPDEAEAFAELDASIARGDKFYTFDDIDAMRDADKAATTQMA